MKKVMVFGTFDLFHPGHQYFLNEAKKYGDYLVVVVARDETVKKVKNKVPIICEHERVSTIEECSSADKAVLGSLTDKYRVIKEEKPDVICLGYDQEFFIDKLSDKLIEFELKTEIVRLKSFKPDQYKSSLLACRL